MVRVVGGWVVGEEVEWSGRVVGWLVRWLVGWLERVVG